MNHRVIGTALVCATFALLSACSGVGPDGSVDLPGADARGTGRDNDGVGSGSGSGAGSGKGGSGSTDAEGGNGGTNKPGTGGTNGGEPGVEFPKVARGASVPYWEYEAENAGTNAIVLDESRAFGDIAAESSGRRAVRLDKSGHKVEFTLEHAANSIVVRYVIPDAPAGGGITATLGLYVNGERKHSLSLTSRYAWLYGGSENSHENAPGPGAHHFYDEVHALIGDLAPGTRIALQKDDSDAAAYYVIDLVDFEQVAPPKSKPADALSVTDFGAQPDDNGDDSEALQRAIDAARSQGKPLFIPKGVYDCRGAPLRASDVTIQGAGMWHSKLFGHGAQFRVSGNNNRFSDFAVFGDTTARDERNPENGFDGPAGTGSRFENLWIEHHKVGYWVGKGDLGHAPNAPLTDGLVLRGLRVRNTFADGINLCNGTVNSVVEQSSFRSTGDDAIAAWSPSFDGVQGANNVFRFNTVQAPWRATCFALYGGRDMRIEDNVCSDTLTYPGILVASVKQFRPHPFEGTTRILRNTLLRAGGPMFDLDHGALKFFAETHPIWNVEVSDLRIEYANFAGIHIEGPNNVSGVSFDNVEIKGAAHAGLFVGGYANGAAKATNVVVSEVGTGLQNHAGGAWVFERGDGNVGW